MGNGSCAWKECRPPAARQADVARTRLSVDVFEVSKICFPNLQFSA